MKKKNCYFIPLICLKTISKIITIVTIIEKNRKIKSRTSLGGYIKMKKFIQHSNITKTAMIRFLVFKSIFPNLLIIKLLFLPALRDQPLE